MRPPPLSPKTGFHHRGRHGERVVAFTAEEFWRWGFSNVQDNVLRGILAEFIVARAIGAPVRTRQSWDEADLVTPDGIKIEVKSTGYVQAWGMPARPSRIIFDGLRSRLWMPGVGTAPVSEYHSDVYVLCLHTARSREAYNPLDLDQWEFWVLPRRALLASNTRRIAYSRLRELGAIPVCYANLAAAVDRVAGEQRAA